MMYVPVLLSDAIVEKLELIWVCCRWRVDLFSTIAADNSTGTYIIHYSIELIAFSAEYTLFDNCNFNLVYRYSLSVNIYYIVMVTRCCRCSCYVLLKMGDSDARNM